MNQSKGTVKRRAGDVVDMLGKKELGEPIKGYGEETHRRRHRHVMMLGKKELGEPIKGYGEETRRGCRRYVRLEGIR